MIPQDLLIFLQANWPLAGSVVLAGFMTFYGFSSHMKGYQALSPEEAVPLINDGAVIIDLRASSEYDAAHIAGAQNHGPEAFKGQFDVLDKEKSYLLYCATGAKAPATASLMKKAGFTSIHALTLGISGWKDANLPVASSKSKKKSISNPKKKTKNKTKSNPVS